tara:strand:- start:434 stop:664 length:231 start_codon:yes stop_codon:yes gene_type:complete
MTLIERKDMYIRIIQLCLLIAVVIMFIFIAIVDQDYARFGFYASLSMIVIIGLWLMRGSEEFIEHMNEQYRNRKDR